MHSENSRIYRSTIKFLSIIIVFIFAVSIFVTMLVSINIVIPLGKTVDMLEFIGQGDLSESISEGLLNFMSTDVQEDYSTLIEVADRYDDAKFVDELVSDFSSTSDKD